MLQLVHDVAPGAKLSYYTAGVNETDFAIGILKLALAGANVIVDDTIYFAEPMFQDGIVAQAVDQVVAQGVAYFVAAGNNARVSYEAPFRDAGTAAPGVPPARGGVLHDFDPGPGVDPFQRLTIPAGGTLNLVLQWDQPFASVSPQSGGAATDLDAYLYDATGSLAAQLHYNVD